MTFLMIAYKTNYDYDYYCPIFPSVFNNSKYIIYFYSNGFMENFKLRERK